MGMGVFQQKEPKKPGAHKIGAAISGPQNYGQKNYGHEAFSEIWPPPQSRSPIQGWILAAWMLASKLPSVVGGFICTIFFQRQTLQKKTNKIMWGDTGRCVKQVQFGKLASYSWTEQFFTPEMSIFGPFALRFQQIGALAWKPCTLSRFWGHLVHRISMPKTLGFFFFCWKRKTHLTEPNVPVDHLSHKSGPNFFPEECSVLL